MCGIAGKAILDEGDPPSREDLWAMISTLHHRGPDGYGFYTDDRVGLAHARLSIIDLDAGGQPIHNEDGRIQVVFNGEIFNYIELRTELEKLGHTFYTRSDTEVIVHLYEQYGDKFVNYLNGQFAIALWDMRKQRLVLARDRVGIRPLFYINNGKYLYFASEVKAIFTQEGIVRSIDPFSMGEIFTFWSSLPPNSLFENIKQLPPGHLLILEKGEQKVNCYWDWTFPSNGHSVDRSAEDWAGELRELLVDSVRLQLRSDVPVGAYLSGGLDSSVITSLIKNFTDTSLRTFSIGFEDDEFDETAYQQELIKYLDTEHTHILCKRSDIGAAFPRVVWHAESAILRTAPTPLMMLSSAVHDSGYKVVLTGEGADEVLGGYDLFKEAKIRRFCSQFPESKRRPLILQRLYPYLKHSPVGTGIFAKRFFEQGMDHKNEAYFAHIPRWSTTHRAWQFFSPEIRNLLSNVDPYTEISRRLPAEIDTWEPLSQAQYIEAHTLMTGYLLNSQGDRVAMANSVEGRFPFLDHRVIEFASQIPSRLKIKGLTEKYILKKAVAGLIPECIRSRTKQPYRAPDSQSFFNDGKPMDYVADLLSEDRVGNSGYFDSKAVTKLVNKCAMGRAIGFSDNMAFVGILSLMLIDEMFIRNYSPLHRYNAN